MCHCVNHGGCDKDGSGGMVDDEVAWCQNGLLKSNNAVEGFHHSFSSLVGHSNPTIWTWLDAVKRHQNLTETQLVRQQTGQPPPPRRKRYLTQERHLLNIMTQFRQVTVYRFLDLCNVAY